jgi:hypothetical protein
MLRWKVMQVILKHLPVAEAHLAPPGLRLRRTYISATVSWPWQDFYPAMLERNLIGSILHRYFGAESVST